MGRKPKDDRRFPDADHQLTDIELGERYGHLIERFHEHLSQDPALLADFVESAAVHYKKAKYRAEARAKVEKATTAQAAARPRDDQKQRGRSQDENRQKVQVSS